VTRYALTWAAPGVDAFAQSWRPTPEWLDGIDARLDALRGNSPEPWFDARTWRVFLNSPFENLEMADLNEYRAARPEEFGLKYRKSLDVQPSTEVEEK